MFKKLKFIVLALVCAFSMTQLTLSVYANTNEEIAPYYAVREVVVNEVQTIQITWPGLVHGDVKVKINGSYEIRDYNTSSPQVINNTVSASVISTPSGYDVDVLSIRVVSNSDSVSVFVKLRWQGENYDSVESPIQINTYELIV